VITNIEAGSTCVVSELNTGSFPSGSTVGYTPLGANTTGVVVDANQNAAVTVTNTFPAATAPQQAVAAETATAPRFTG
jgi:hypothetical protein